MNQRAKVVRRGQSGDEPLDLVWDGLKTLTLHLPDQTRTEWHYEIDDPQLEEFDQGLAVRCNMTRVFAADAESALSLRRWFAVMADSSSDNPLTAVDIRPSESDEDVRRFASLLASGAITLGEFQKLVNLPLAEAADEQDSTLDAEENEAVERFQEAFERTWPDRNERMRMVRDLDGDMSYTSAPPASIDWEQVRNLLQRDRATFMTSTTTALGLTSSYLQFGAEFTRIPRMRPSRGLLGALNDIAKLDQAESALMRRLDRELKRGFASEQTLIVQERVKEAWRHKQGPMRRFAESMSRTDLPFI